MNLEKTKVMVRSGEMITSTRHTCGVFGKE